MGHTCILTDNAAQFTRLNFPGNKYIKCFKSSLEFKKGSIVDLQGVKVCDFPTHINSEYPIRLILPTKDAVAEQIIALNSIYDDVFIILVSKDLSTSFEIFEDTVKKFHGKADIHLLDSESIAIGEGQIIQMAANMIEKNISAAIVEETLREAIPHIYTLLCTPNFSYLHKSGFLDIGQAVSGEYLGFLPIFTLEDGQLHPVEKVKNIRSVIDYFVEFIDEFDNIDNVSFIQPADTGHNESKMIRQHVEEFYPQTSYSEHTINPYLASLIGPQGMGIVITESI